MFLGMAGVVPYLATSLQTVYLAYEINHAATTGDGILLSGDSAELLLHMLEHVQVGYGAVVSKQTIVDYSKALQAKLTMLRSSI